MTDGVSDPRFETDNGLQIRKMGCADSRDLPLSER